MNRVLLLNLFVTLNYGPNHAAIFKNHRVWMETGNVHITFTFTVVRPFCDHPLGILYISGHIRGVDASKGKIKWIDKEFVL